MSKSVFRATFSFLTTNVESVAQFDDLMMDAINENTFVTINSYKTGWLDQKGADVTFFSESACSDEEWSRFVEFIRESF